MFGGALLSGLLVLNHQQEKGESFQDADIVEVFSTQTSSSLLFSKPSSLSAIFLATAIPTYKSTASPIPSPSKTPRISFLPSAAVFQPLQRSGGQTGESPVIPSPSTISKLFVSPSPSSSPTPTPIPTQLPTATLSPSPTPTQSPRISPSSTPTATPESTLVPSETPNNTNSASTILINEVQVGGQDVGDEFIELYNPTTTAIDISGWSVQYLSGNSTSVDKAVKKNFEAGNNIPAKGFFLIARAKNASGADGYIGNVVPDLDHRSFSLSGASTGGKIFIVNDAAKIDSFADSNIVDTIDYSFLVPENGQSLERKSDGNFELNNNPSPQNTNT